MHYSELYRQALEKYILRIDSAVERDTAALEIQILMEKAFGLTRSGFWINKNEKIVDPRSLQRFYRYFRRLKNLEPLAYIIREKFFYKDVFHVDRNVLIPRPETELLVEKAIQLSGGKRDILEIGGGSGNIAISVAKYARLPVLTTENHRGTLRVLRRNIAGHNLKTMVFPVLADLFPQNEKPFDLIVSNPPYLSEVDWEILPPRIREFEPRQALVGGAEGYEVIERIIAGAASRLKAGGRLLLEIGYDQKPVVEHLLRKFGFRKIQFFKDYNRIFRVVSGQR